MKRFNQSIFRLLQICGCVSPFTVIFAQVNESIAANNGNVYAGYDDGDDKPLMLLKKNGSDHGLTALINHQLQGKLNSNFNFMLFSFCAICLLAL